MSTFLLSQILAALAFAAGLAAFQFRARPVILRCWSVCAALNGAHFLLLGVPGAATLAVCASLWVVHNAIIGSPVATVMELAFLASNAIGWRRFHGRAKMAAVPLRTVHSHDEPERRDGD